MRNGFFAFIAGTTLGLASFSAVSQEACRDDSAPRLALAGSGVYSYEGAARHLGQPVLEAAGFTGKGTAVAHVENKTLSWFFRFEDGRPPPFGACVQPKDTPPDHWGWAPESDPAYPDQPCRVAWVMCIEADAVNGKPVREGSEASAKGLRSCLRGTDGMYNNKKIWSENIGGHATSGAIGITTMAPDTKIVAIALNGVETLDTRAAFRWLYTRGDDYVLKRKNLTNDQVYLKARTKDERYAWRKYWRQTFGDQSPAEKFNIVSAALTWRHNVGGFSEACAAVNPEIPQGDQDGDGNIDIADNCIYVDNGVRTNFGTADEPFWITEYPDGDEDGRGNMCDGDLDNDNDWDQDDIDIFTSIWQDYDNFVPPIDLNDDGVTDELDKAMFYNSVDFNWDGLVDGQDSSYFSDELSKRPLGATNADWLPFYEDKRNPNKYYQDKLYLQGASGNRLSVAKYSEFKHEFSRLRQAGVLPVITAGSDGYTNAVLWPACSSGAMAVSGVQHTSDVNYYASYDKVNNRYGTNSTWSMRVNASQKIPVLVTHGPGRTWLPLEERSQTEEILGCDVNPLTNGGYAGSFTPAVVAGSVAALKSPGLMRYAKPRRIKKMLMQTTERAYVRRDCTVVLSPNRAPYDSEQKDIYCPEYLDPEVDNTFIDYSLPLMNLSDTYSLVKRLRASKTNLLRDADKDGFDNANDNCTRIWNKGQRDSDGDGYGDACDADYNNDGMTDWQDGSYFAENYLDTQMPHGDFDGDGNSDSTDFSILMTTLMDKRPGPSGLDKERDGIVDQLDNCKGVSNGPWTNYSGGSVAQQNQADADRDFFGDKCDGDLNQDTVVDEGDAILIQTKIDLGKYFAPADYNYDAVLDQADVAIFNSTFNVADAAPPGPSGVCRFWLKMSDQACSYYD